MMLRFESLATGSIGMNRNRMPSRRCSGAFRRRFVPGIDLMEDRTLLSTLTVMNNNDSGLGSLRATIAAATSGATINFSSKLMGETITLTSGPLTLGVNLNNDGLGADKLTVCGGGTEGVFVVSAGVTATIDNLTIANGLAVQGAGIDNFGNMTVINCNLSGNQAIGGSGAATTPDAANGGAIMNEVGATLTLRQSSLADNVAAASPGNDSFGGALVNLGAATITGCVFQGNEATGGGSSSFFDGSTGGAIESFGFPPSQLYGSTLNVSNSTFVDNEAVAASGTDYGVGGAIDLEFGVIATITGSSFAGNVSTGGAGCDANGGAINTEGCTLTLNNSSFTGNHAIAGTFNGSFGGEGSGAYGGAVLEDVAGTTVIATNCTLTDNKAIGGSGASTSAQFAGQAGGGAIIDSGGLLSLTVCTATIGNQAIGGSGANSVTSSAGIGYGGGIAFLGGSTGTVINSALVDNVSQGGFGTAGGGGGEGGGIEDSGSTLLEPSVLTMTNSTLAGNQALGGAGGIGVAGGGASGGGLDISFDSAATVTGTMFVSNLAQGGRGGAGASGGGGLGGGISVANASFADIPDTSSLSLGGSLLIGNVAQGGTGGARANGGTGFGGGVFIGSDGTAAIDQIVVTANLALGGLAAYGGSGGQGIGGGLYIATGGSVTLKKSLVIGNWASTSNNDIFGTVTYL